MTNKKTQRVSDNKAKKKRRKKPKWLIKKTRRTSHNKAQTRGPKRGP
jgi:hypothetical protein